MYRKILTILFAVLWCFSLIAQEGPEVSPNNDPVNIDPALEAIWDVLLDFDVAALSGAAGNAGAEWNGTYFYSTRWASNLIHEYSADGTTLIREFSVSGVSGLRDLAWDGTYMYGGAAANTIYQMDFATNTLVGTISSPVPVRYIAYDEASDAFWVGNWDTPPTLVSRAGATLATFQSGLTSQYGAAYDNCSPGGPYLWIFDQGGSGGVIHQFSITTGTATGVTHDVLTDVGAGSTGIAGGLFAMQDWNTGLLTLGGLLQSGSPNDEIFVYELGPACGGGGLFYESFETYISGQQVACQNPVDWTTWSLAPCGNDDALVSSNYAQSGSNSALIDFSSPRWVDLVKPLGNVTTGHKEIRFSIYIPQGKGGYFNTLGDFAGAASIWAMQVYFNVDGTASIDAGTAAAATWNYTQGAWHLCQVIINLGADQAQFWFDGTLIHQWQYTLGTFGGGCPLQIGANDFFAPAGNATDEMYIDDYYFGDYPVPVELTSFTADVNNSGQVVLNWETATELNNLMFEIERKDANSEFRTIGYVDGAGTTTEPQQYSYTDVTVGTGTFTYRLKQVDFDGRYYFSDAIEIEVNGPLSFALEQNYPNPFNPSTNIKFSVPESGDIKLAVYNVVGEEVAVLVNGFTEAGFYNVTFNASSLPSGVYLYKLQSANSVETRKMMLLK